MSASEIMNQKMTAIADAIREKTEETSPLSLDAMAMTIAGLGGLSFTTGTFQGVTEWTTTGVESYINFTVPHNLGKIPSFIIVFLDDSVYTPLYNSSTTASYAQLIYAFAEIYTNETAGELYIMVDTAHISHTRFEYYTSTGGKRYTGKASVQQQGTTLPLSGQSSLSTYYAIRNVNESTFDAPAYAYSGKTYRWYAFG